ncbi:MAG: 2-hydroxychromene-2-carboxylate isomerase [Pseudomonadota bacterium]|nr:2-hydroxychromene-2-carboxylate isomerase [Pseudomonadota bacterium]
MPAPIDFYFELSSPYSYLAARKIGDVAKLYDRAVHWWPIMLGVIFQTTQNWPLMEQPLKADYTDRDVRRVARDMGLPFAPPVAGFPFASHVGARAIYWAADQEEGADARLAVALFQAVFERGQSITDAAAVGRVADAVGLDGAAVIDAVGMPAVKDRLRAANDRALAAGVCGTPFFIVDEEPFWGCDRLDHVERWLATGGW